MYVNCTYIYIANANEVIWTVTAIKTNQSKNKLRLKIY